MWHERDVTTLHSIAPCARFEPASGTGRRDTGSGTSGSAGGPLVSSYAVDDGARLVLFDPLEPPAEIEKLAAERQTAIVLTCPWHRRDAQALANRYGTVLYVPPPDAGDASPVDGTVFREGDRPIERRSSEHSRRRRGGSDEPPLHRWLKDR